jgi:hypothetical protein
MSTLEFNLSGAGMQDLAHTFYEKWPSLRSSAIGAAAIAVVCFFLIHVYYPLGGFIANIMAATINLTSACPGPYDIDPNTYEKVQSSAFCGVYVPYRWILALLVLFVAASALIERRKSEQKKIDS